MVAWHSIVGKCRVAMTQYQCRLPWSYERDRIRSWAASDRAEDELQCAGRQRLLMTKQYAELAS